MIWRRSRDLEFHDFALESRKAPAVSFDRGWYPTAANLLAGAAKRSLRSTITRQIAVIEQVASIRNGIHGALPIGANKSEAHDLIFAKYICVS